MDIEGISLRTLPELVAFALVTEHFACERYRTDARDMAASGNDSLASVFRRLVEEEERHAKELESFVEQRGMALDMETARKQFESVIKADRESRTGEEAGVDQPMTPYGVLARAVRTEERAFRFYCQVAATATNPQMRAYAEVFAHEELAHAALFRAERRNAYRLQQGEAALPMPDVTALQNLSDLMKFALGLESHLVNEINEGSEQVIQSCHDLVKELRDELAAHSEAGQTKPGAQVGVNGSAMQFLSGMDANLDAVLDRMFSIYEHIARTSKIEKVARKAQVLMATTLDRIESLC